MNGDLNCHGMRGRRFSAGEKFLGLLVMFAFLYGRFLKFLAVRMLDFLRRFADGMDRRIQRLREERNEREREDEMV